MFWDGDGIGWQCFGNRMGLGRENRMQGEEVTDL